MKTKNEILIDMYRHLVGSGRIKTQLDIANAVGSPKSNISSAFGGNERYLTSKLLHRINRAFGSPFSESWIETGEGSMLKSTASDVIPEYGIDYKEKYYDALEEIREIRRELDSVKNILLHAKEDTPIVQGNVRGAGTG